MKHHYIRLAVGLLASASLTPLALSQSDSARPEAKVRAEYKQLIEAENAHDLKAVATLVEDSPNSLFVAKAPVGWQGYWGKRDIMEHFGELYQHPFRIDPKYDEEKVVFLAAGVAETYVPVSITAVYGHFPQPTPFIMVLLWVDHAGSWKMVTDIPIPIPTTATTPSPSPSN